jgi:hypothetical protein
MLVCVAAPVVAKAPDCSGPEHYPGSMAYVYLKDAGVVTPETVEFDHVTSRVIASQRIRQNLWRQVFRVTFPLKSGGKVEAIIVNDASKEECSMSAPQVFLVSKQFP